MTPDSTILVLAILSSSFWGSWHCAAMCGPMASLAAEGRCLSGYHLGRGFSYAMIGTLGGYVGSFFLANELQQIRWVSGFLFAIVLITMGLRIIGGKPAFRMAIPFLRFLPSQSPTGFALGMLSVFLPCSWLYTYFLAAVATRSPGSGAFVMVLFWAGGLPALSALSVFMKTSIRSAPKKQKAIAGAILTAAGLYALLSFHYLPVPTQ